jgi:CubicO group peptidase (beta-lactamase class C family)
MQTFYAIVAVIIIAFFCFIGLAGGQEWDLQSLPKLLSEHQKKSKLPAMGVALVTSEGIQHLATSGLRKKGSQEPVTDTDLWHIGSCGKAITATMIARLVEAKKLRWDQTLGETFPELASEMSKDFQSITLSELLSHRSGLGANFKTVAYVNAKDLVASRIKVLKDAMKTSVTKTRGEFLYSNWGYTIAGAMAERAAGETWEKLIQKEVFQPLGMKSAGFGGTGTVGKIDQPWPHGGNGEPMESNGPRMDNVPTMGPAGTIHMTLADWATFVGEHLKGRQGKSQYLTKETFQELHTPKKGDYAFGWIEAERGWGGKVLNHAGDNTMNFALVWAAPEKDFAVLVVTNQSNAHRACDGAAGGLILGWVKKLKGN